MLDMWTYGRMQIVSKHVLFYKEDNKVRFWRTIYRIPS